MKSWSVIGLLFTAAILTTIPISPRVTRGELTVGRAQVLADGPYRQVHRRVHRRSYRYVRRAYRHAYYVGSYYHDCVGYFGPGCCGAPTRCRRGWW